MKGEWKKNRIIRFIIIFLFIISLIPSIGLTSYILYRGAEGYYDIKNGLFSFKEPQFYNMANVRDTFENEYSAGVVSGYLKFAETKDNQHVIFSNTSGIGANYSIALTPQFYWSIANTNVSVTIRKHDGQIIYQNFSPDPYSKLKSEGIAHIAYTSDRYGIDFTSDSYDPNYIVKGYSYTKIIIKNDDLMAFALKNCPQYIYVDYYATYNLYSEESKNSSNLQLTDYCDAESIINEYAKYHYGGVGYNSTGYDENRDSYYVEIKTEARIPASYFLTISTSLSNDVTSKKDVFREMYFDYLNYINSVPSRTTILALDLISAALTLVLFMLCVSIAGWKQGYDSPQLKKIDRIPSDILLLITLLLQALPVILTKYLTGRADTLNYGALIFGIAAVFLLIPIIPFFSCVRRIKTGTLLKNSFIYKYIIKLVRSVPLLLTIIAGIIIYCGLSLLVLLSGSPTHVFIWGLATFILTAGICVNYYQFRRIARETRAIADGDVTKIIDSRKMVSDLRKHAEDINRIRNAVQTAVEDRLKSERMKTDLITNVSHDIKTPLTSIINYTDLLKGTNLTDPTSHEYISVIERQSQRLKRLVEDIVEASKVSSGCISVSITPVSIDELLNQAVAEYQEKLFSKSISPVLNVEQNVHASADGRLLWRVFDNLLSNICKYSQPGTRVYIDVFTRDDFVFISFRNISSQPLNISAEELMERFVRGDVSRYTEGSGLGLYIARTLMELQYGNLALSIDGDLFRAIISLPLCSPAEVGRNEMPEASENFVEFEDSHNQGDFLEDDPMISLPAGENAYSLYPGTEPRMLGSAGNTQ